MVAEQVETQATSGADPWQRRAPVWAAQLGGWDAAGTIRTPIAEGENEPALFTPRCAGLPPRPRAG